MGEKSSSPNGNAGGPHEWKKSYLAKIWSTFFLLLNGCWNKEHLPPSSGPLVLNPHLSAGQHR